MWGHLCTELTNLYNFNVSFSTHKSEVLIHLSQWQYWWWFWFSYFWTFYFFITLRSIKHRIFKMNIRLNTSFRSRGKWGDYLVTLIPLSWCMNILLNSNFILRMIEWQSESGSLIIRIHGKQWYWVYKYDLANVLSILNTPKNIGHDRWISLNKDSQSANNKYLQATLLKIRSDSQQDYWGEVLSKDFNVVSNFKATNKTNSNKDNLLGDTSHLFKDSAVFDDVFCVFNEDIENYSVLNESLLDISDDFTELDLINNSYDLCINNGFLPTAQSSEYSNFELFNQNLDEFDSLSPDSEVDFVAALGLSDVVITSETLSFNDFDLIDGFLFDEYYDGFAFNLFDFENVTITLKDLTPVTKIFEYTPIKSLAHKDDQNNLIFYENNALDDDWEVYSNLRASEFTKPVRFNTAYINQQLMDNQKQSDILFVKFFDTNDLVTEKPEENIDFMVIKQKRYKRKQNINNYWVNCLDVNSEATAIKKIDNQASTSRFLQNNQIISQITATGAENSFNFYSNIKLNRVRSELFSINLSRRLLRTTRTLVLPAYTNISIIANSYDVVHSWFIPGLGLKIDCVPGKSTHHSLYIDNVGLYYGQCAEICGRYHHHMPIRVCALPFEHFIVWWTNKGLPKSTRIRYNSKKVENVLLLKYTW